MTKAISERWFEDWTVGEVIEAGIYRMEQDRMIEFAKEFDPQVFHTDPEAAASTVYGGLIASGWHTAAVMMRLLTDLLGPASMGSSGGERLLWPAPVRPGDVLRLRVTVVDVIASTSKPDRGVVKIVSELISQDDVVVLSFEPAMFQRRNPQP